MGRKLLALVLLTVLAIEIVGCGSSSSGSSSGSTQAAEKSTHMAIGETVKLDNGLEVTVTDVKQGYRNVFDDTVSTVYMTYKNGSDAIRPFNSYDWRGEDANGVIRDPDGIGDEDSIGMGDLQPGGTVSGCVTFDCASVAKVYYMEDILLSDDSDIYWTM